MNPNMEHHPDHEPDVDTQKSEPQMDATMKNTSASKDSQSKRWKQMIMKKYWDYGIWALLCICSCTLGYLIYASSLLSIDWQWKIDALLLAVNLLFLLFLFFRKTPNWFVWICRVLMLSLCGGLFFLSFSLNNFQTALEAITKPETATTINVSLITKKEGGAHTLAELSGKKIGIQNANDATNANFVKENLAKEPELKNVTYVEEIDYSSLYQKLQSGELDGLIITDYYFKTLLKENYPTIEEDIFILKSYQKEKDVSLNTSTKDIRYEPFTVYLAGVDEGDDPSINARSDVNIVLIVNPLANHIEMVSIPRDSFVPNPALHNTSDKLTHLGLNGVENSMRGIEQVIGFEIDYYVKLNFFSVIDIIDAIGEIEVDVPVSFCEQDENRSFAEEDLICLNEGVQKVNGKQALAFARHRKSYTDIMRGKAQQEVISGIINALTTASGATHINDVMKIAPKSVSTNMPMEQVTNFISAQLDNLKPWTIESIALENGVDAKLETASMSGQLLYVMLLNRLDMQAVFDSYQTMINQMQFSSFTFHLNNLKEDKVTMPMNPNVLWAGMNTSAYEGNSSTIDNSGQDAPDEQAPITLPQVPTDPQPPNTEEPSQDPTPPDNPITPPDNGEEAPLPPNPQEPSDVPNETPDTKPPVDSPTQQ